MGANHHHVCMPVIVQSHCRSQARLMFVTTLKMDNFGCTKMNAHFQKFTACTWEELIYKYNLASPLPLILVSQLTVLFHI